MYCNFVHCTVVDIILLKVMLVLLIVNKKKYFGNKTTPIFVVKLRVVHKAMLITRFFAVEIHVLSQVPQAH